MKPLAPLFICILVSLHSVGQVSYQEGYIVRGGDTVRGRIAYQEWGATPRRITFVGGAAGKEESLGPEEISAFFVNGELYRSQRVRIYPYSLDPAVVTDPGWRGEPYDTTLFLRLVTGGMLTLYAYLDEQGTPYFWLQAVGKPPELLRIGNKVIQKGAESDVQTDDLYKYQLADLVAGCPLIAQRPVEVDYEENALSRLVTTYNHCGKELVQSRKGRYPWKVHVVPLIGGLHSSVKLSGNTDAAYAGWPSFNGPTGGLGFLFQPTRGRRRLAIQLDGLFDQFLLKSGRLQKNYYQSYTAAMEYDEIKGNLQVRYQMPVGAARPWIGAGVSNTLIINNTSKQDLFDASSSQTIHQPLFGSTDDMRVYRAGVFVSLGAAFKHWVLEGRAERTQGLVSLPGVTSPVTNFYLLLGYMF